MNPQKIPTKGTMPAEHIGNTSLPFFGHKILSIHTDFACPVSGLPDINTRNGMAQFTLPFSAQKNKDHVLEQES